MPTAAPSSVTIVPDQRSSIPQLVEMAWIALGAESRVARCWGSPDHTSTPRAESVSRWTAAATAR